MGLSSVRAMAVGAAPDPATKREIGEQRHLYGPAVDFLCLGGVSLLLIPIVFMLPEKELSLTFGTIGLAVANVINHPHFAFSYQIFYEGFRHKAFGQDTGAALRARYIFAGIVVPIALAAFFAFSMINGDSQILGYGANLMGFLVGWHYVKQGYGMLMVDAALKRQFFNDADKKILLINSYAVWALSWLTVNSIVSEKALWGIEYYMFQFPPLVQAAAICLAVATTALAASTLLKRWRANGGSLPVSGVVAYFVSLYLWLLLIRWNVLWLLMVPALHSLQYMTVATRYYMNRLKAGGNAGGVSPLERLGPVRRYQWRYAGFLALGLILGFLGFWGAPSFFDVVMPYDHAVFGTTAFLFVFWVFINVHHYFLDNVMWRSQNPDVRKHLFS